MWISNLHCLPLSEAHPWLLIGWIGDRPAVNMLKYFANPCKRLFMIRRLIWKLKTLLHTWATYHTHTHKVITENITFFRKKLKPFSNNKNRFPFFFFLIHQKQFRFLYLESKIPIYFNTSYIANAYFKTCKW